jgi:hypothetical protein
MWGWVVMITGETGTPSDLIKGLCHRRDKKIKKEKLSKSKLNSKTKFKKRREPKAKLDIILDVNLLRRPRSAEPFPRASACLPKEKKNSK